MRALRTNFAPYGLLVTADVPTDDSTYNLPQLAARKINVVIGTTGWQAREPEMRRIAKEAGIGVLAASTFSLGMNVFQLAVEEASRHFANQSDSDPE